MKMNIKRRHTFTYIVISYNLKSEILFILIFYLFKCMKLFIIPNNTLFKIFFKMWQTLSYEHEAIS